MARLVPNLTGCVYSLQENTFVRWDQLLYDSIIIFYVHLLAREREGVL